MRSHPEAAREYSELKQTLAQQYPTNIQSYMDGKADFIHSIDNKAFQWRSLGL
ncbi:GrpB family protein [Chamaesiphon sp. OTE_75_metabat_556]|uniref:GrpB family protein n=1 Tax=Chamaesiphon sp. OTE_75_metabat_556 TaxID=2964692 RepID=UPI0037C122E0